MLLDKLCGMGMTFVDPLTLRDNPKKRFLPTISVWFKNCGRFANDQFANVLVVLPTSQVSLLRLIGRFANLII